MYTEVDDDVMLTRASHQSDMDVVRGSSSGGSFSRTITSPDTVDNHANDLQTAATHPAAPFGQFQHRDLPAVKFCLIVTSLLETPISSKSRCCIDGLLNYLFTSDKIYTDGLDHISHSLAGMLYLSYMINADPKKASTLPTIAKRVAKTKKQFKILHRDFSDTY
jgi:hypothetical protein